MDVAFAVRGLWLAAVVVEVAFLVLPKGVQSYDLSEDWLGEIGLRPLDRSPGSLPLAFAKTVHRRAVLPPQGVCRGATVGVEVDGDQYGERDDARVEVDDDGLGEMRRRISRARPTLVHPRDAAQGLKYCLRAPVTPAAETDFLQLRHRAEGTSRAEVLF